MSLGPIVSAGTELDGITTLVWGTAGSLITPAPAAGYAGEGFYIVESVDEAEDAEKIHGENGTGIKAWRMLLKHGKIWNITVTDDTTMTAPSVGSTVTVLDFLGNKTLSYVAVVTDNNYRAARKQPGQRVLQVENLTLIDAAAA